MNPFSTVLLAQWSSIRRLTYDYLAVLEKDHLPKRLPFPESQSLGYQFWCMVGAHESYLRSIEAGRWKGFSSSLDEFEVVTPAIIQQQMQKADAHMAALLKDLPLEEQRRDGHYGYEIVFQMIKHEMHHHGQLINFLYYLHLPIPPSWHEEWALE